MVTQKTSNECDIEDFRKKLLKTIESNRSKFEDSKKNWVIKGFIDIEKNIYSVSIDTKVVSKIIELIIFPILDQFAKDNNYKLITPKYQNHYPDATFEHKVTGERIAIDIKTTYRDSTTSTKCKGFTLGAYGGYFIDREGTKNITYPYSTYSHHLVLGVIYTQNEDISEVKTYSVDEIDSIPSAIGNFIFLVQEKYKLATKRPGSGNTTNIGSIGDIDDLVNGRGPFANEGVEAFDKYWIDYYYNRKGE